MFQISNPCSENWDKMKIGIESRFCESCQKNVMDFTNKSRDEILRYLLLNQNKGVCGRIYPHQLDFSFEEVMIDANKIAKQHKNSNLPFYMLAAMSLIMLNACQNDAIDENTTNRPSFEERMHQNPTKDTNSNKDSSSCNSNNYKKERISTVGEIIQKPPPLIGVVVNDSSYRYNENKVLINAEKMPEFVGGTQQLFSYIHKNIVYPQWEKDHKIEGKVYAKFVVDKNGEIKDVEIVKTMIDAPNFGNEVIRVLNSMPKWVPGEQNGEKVDVQMVIPFNFKL